MAAHAGTAPAFVSEGQALVLDFSAALVQKVGAAVLSAPRPD